MSIKRKTEVYKISILERQPELGRIDKIELNDFIILKDFIDYYYINYVHTEENDRKVQINSKNICYYIDSASTSEEMNSVVLKYIKFNKSTNVVNIKTLESQYKKDKNEGDEERQHYLVKTYSGINRAILIYERITGAVSIGKINAQMNRAFKGWIKDKYIDEEERKYLLGFEIKIEIVPSPDFIEELSKMDKISLLKVTVEKERIVTDEDIIYSEDNISRKDIDIIYKPIPKLSFSKSKIISYFNNYVNNRTKIKRIVINGRRDGNNIALDTEQMKLSKYIHAEVDIDGLINSEDILNKYKNLVDESFNEYFNDIITGEVIIEIDESEE